MSHNKATIQHSEKSVKEQLIAFVTNAHSTHKANKAKVIEVIQLDSTCNFGIKVFEDAQKSESLISAINLPLSYIYSDDFKGLSEQDIKDYLAKKTTELINQEVEHVLDGFSNREMILLTGFSRYRMFIDSVLNTYIKPDIN